jgi:hypothetical protein
MSFDRAFLWLAEALLKSFSLVPGAVVLALRLSASQLLYLFLGFAARAGALALGSGLFAGCALQFFPFQLVFNFGGVCHV